MLITTQDHKGRNANLDESMIPAINVVFLLLVFFMIAGQIEVHSKLLAVPESVSAAELDDNAITIKLLADGQREINDQPINGDLLEALTAAGLSEKSELSLFAHRELSVTALDPVLEVVGQLGIKQLQIVTENLQ